MFHWRLILVFFSLSADYKTLVAVTLRVGDVQRNSQSGAVCSHLKLSITVPSQKLDDSVYSVFELA